MEPEKIPPIPRKMRAFLIEETGVEPELRLRGKRLHLEHKNERVRMTITYEFGVINGAPTWYQTGSTLEIGGLPVNLAEDEVQYVQVFKGDAEPTGPVWQADMRVQRSTPRHAGHNMLRAVQSGPARSRRR